MILWVLLCSVKGGYFVVVTACFCLTRREEEDFFFGSQKTNESRINMTSLKDTTHHQFNLSVSSRLTYSSPQTSLGCGLWHVHGFLICFIIIIYIPYIINLLYRFHSFSLVKPNRFHLYPKRHRQILEQL